MKKSYLIGLITVGLLVLGGWLLMSRPTTPATSPSTQATAPAQVTASVLMKQDSFEPETLTVKKGATVEFRNVDSVARWPASNIHPTHTIYAEFDPRQSIEPNKSWQFTFIKVGRWKYHDHLSPSIRGTIIVTE